MVAIEFENDSAMCGRFSADVYRRSFKNASIVSLLTQGTLSCQRLSGLCPAFQALISFCLLIRKRRLVSLAAEFCFCAHRKIPLFIFILFSITWLSGYSPFSSPLFCSDSVSFSRIADLVNRFHRTLYDNEHPKR